MKRPSAISLQYTVAQFLFWMTCCASTCFMAVHLQYLGISNTQIGLMSSAACVLGLILSPSVASLVDRSRRITAKKALMLLIMITGITYGSFTIFKLPIPLVIALYTIKNSLFTCQVPMMNSLGMHYETRGFHINFSISRGIGSLGWAIPAVLFGLLLEHYDPPILGPIYIGLAVLLIGLLLWMPDPEDKSTAAPAKKAEKQKGLLLLCLKNRNFMLIALGILFDVVGYNLGTTYAINIVRRVGGGEFASGLTQFICAGSETIFMFVFAWLIKRYTSVRTLKISAVFFIIRFFIMYIAWNLPVVMFGYFLQGPSTGFYILAVVYFVDERFGAKHRTQGQAIFTAMTSSIASLIGTPVGGWLTDSFGISAALLFCFILTLIGGVLIFMASEKEDKIIS